MKKLIYTSIAVLMMAIAPGLTFGSGSVWIDGQDQLDANLWMAVLGLNLTNNTLWTATSDLTNAITTLSGEDRRLLIGGATPRVDVSLNSIGQPAVVFQDTNAVLCLLSTRPNNNAIVFMSRTSSDAWFLGRPHNDDNLNLSWLNRATTNWTRLMSFSTNGTVNFQTNYVAGLLVANGVNSNDAVNVQQLTSVVANGSNAAWHVNGDNKPTASMNGGGQAFTNVASIRGSDGLGSAFFDIDNNQLYERVAGTDNLVMNLAARRAYSYEEPDKIMFSWYHGDYVDFKTNEIRTAGYLTGKAKNGSATNDPVNVQQMQAADAVVQGNVDLVSNKLNQTVFSLFMINPTNGTYNVAQSGYMQYPVTVTNIMIRGTNACGDLLRCGVTNKLSDYTVVYTGATADTTTEFTNITGLSILYTRGQIWGWRMTNGSADNLQIMSGASW